MSEHDVPRGLIDYILRDLKSRLAEFGAERPEGISAAIALLEGLPSFDDGAELELEWYSENPPASATFQLTGRTLELTVSEVDGHQELYSCWAGHYPTIDSDWKAWLHKLEGLNAPELTISFWEPPEPDAPPIAPELEVTIARLNHANFLSHVSVEIQRSGDLKFLTYDTGKAPEAAFGGDFDRWVSIKADTKDVLLLALLKDRYDGDIEALGKFREFCALQGIAHSYDTY